MLGMHELSPWELRAVGREVLGLGSLTFSNYFARV